jgi:hypothetical protein
MVRSIPPRTMRNIWDAKKKRAGSNSFRPIPSQSKMHNLYDKDNVRQKYSSQINSHETSGTSGALYKQGGLEFRSVQGQPRNIYRAGGGQGMIYSKKKLKDNMSRTEDTLNPPSSKLDQIIEDTETKIFETDEKISVIIERCLDEVTNVFYDAAKEEVVIQADKDYSIPLKLKKVNTKTLEWSYNNGVIEIVFQKKMNNSWEGKK